MDWWQENLMKRKTSGVERALNLPLKGIDFYSNDYLGLARNPELHKRITQTHSTNGSGGSRLLAGNSAEAEELEHFLAAHLGTEASLVFNSGYNANLSIFSLVGRKDLILLDEYAHASLKDGARLANAKVQRFRHNDLEDLARRLKQADGLVWVVVESVYSMHGDRAPLRELATLLESFNAHLIVDEAHATGVFGPGGAGLSHPSLVPKVFARIHTFGKGLGLHGAAISGSAMLKAYLINFARPFIYTTALPPSAYQAIQLAFQYIGQQPELAQRLEEKINLFAHYFGEHNDSSIQVLKPLRELDVKHLAEQLRSSGHALRAILPPTVPLGQERIRVCLHVFNTEEEIASLANAYHTLVS